jgi:MYXO-CTERM domain-containing protein
MPRDDRLSARLALLLSFSAFFVFPALPIGRTTALTIPVAFAGVVILASLPRLKLSECSPFAWMMAPALISGGYVLFIGTALAPEVVPKAIVATAMSLVVVIPALRLLRAGYGDQFILGAALAILVHAALGAYQVFAFERSEFPFADLMNTNPGMALTAQDPETYAEYVKRPFGLFAEPSAMAACIGPWLVLIARAVFSPSGGGSRPRTVVLALALASGLWLVVASKSGMSAPIVAAAALTALAAAFARRRRSIAARAVALALGGAIALGATMWLTENASSRFDLPENESWQARLESLGLGIRSLSASLDSLDYLLGGVGPGQAYFAVNSSDRRYRAAHGVKAVWSVGLNYALENGLLAVAAMLWLAACAAWSIWASRDRLVGAACAAVWLTGIFLATSYVGQPALWTGLALLLSWRFVTRPEPDAVGPELGGEDASGRRLDGRRPLWRDVVLAGPTPTTLEASSGGSILRRSTPTSHS